MELLAEQGFLLVFFQNAQGSFQLPKVFFHPSNGELVLHRHGDLLLWLHGDLPLWLHGDVLHWLLVGLVVDRVPFHISCFPQL